MSAWVSQGAHRYYVQDDVMFWESHGEITLADMMTAYGIVQRQSQIYGYSLSVYDARGGVSLGPAARRYSSEANHRVSLLGATAIFGSGLALRTVMFLLYNASRLVGRALPPLYYCATEEEAMKWLAGQRQQLRALAQAPK